MSTLGPYHLIQAIASGGMASVWLAVDERTGRAVALKRILRTIEDEALRRAFADEAALCLQLKHPNVVEAIEFGEATTTRGQEQYLVLELLQGRSLLDVVRTAEHCGRRVPIAVATGIVRDIARGLSHIHALKDAAGRPLGIVHRDVSPHNVFVCLDGTARLIDFGIAKAAMQTHSSDPGEIKGKLGYLAPEQIRGHAPDARLDVFSLGIVMYELFTGQRLFHGDNDANTLFRVLDLHVPSPEEVRPDLPAGLGAVARRALKRDRDRRLPSAEMLADTLEAGAEYAGLRLDPAETRAFMASLFPDDARLHADRVGAAHRRYLQLAESDAEGVPTIRRIDTRRRRAHASRPLMRATLALGAVTLSALAAASTIHLLNHRAANAPVATPVHGSAPRQTAPSQVEPAPYELPAPTAMADSVPTPPRHAKQTQAGCKVFVSLSAGPTTVCPPAKPSRR